MKRTVSLAFLGAAFMAMAAWAQVLPEEGRAASVPAPSEASARAAGRQAVRKEREAIAQALRQSEADCYQRFAVEDCLRKARRHARDAQAVLRQRESVWDEAERQERAAQRLEDIRQRQRARTAPVPTPARPAVAPGRVDRNTEEAHADQRAHHLAERQRAARKAQAQHNQAVQQKAESERLRRAERLQAATARKARVQQRQADEAAQGKKPAAPLPP